MAAVLPAGSVFYFLYHYTFLEKSKFLYNMSFLLNCHSMKTDKLSLDQRKEMMSDDKKRDSDSGIRA